MIPREIQRIIDASDLTPEEWRQVEEYFGDSEKALAERMFRTTAGDTIEHSVYEGKLSAAGPLYYEHTQRARMLVQQLEKNLPAETTKASGVNPYFLAALLLGAVNRADSPKLRQEGMALRNAQKQ